MNAFELERKDLHRQLDVILAQTKISKEDQKRADGLLSKIASLRSDDERRSLAAKTAKEMGIPYNVTAPTEASATEHDLRNYFAYGKEARTYAGMSVATDASGGFLVPQTIYSKVTSALKL